jgi:hypothetical protein
MAMPADDVLRCRVCGLVQDEHPWGVDGRFPTYGIYDCCGVEFGYEDWTKESTLAYRAKWLASGGEWRDATSRPAAWDRDEQLTRVPAAFRSE